jgi:hypothetical protein
MLPKLIICMFLDIRREDKICCNEWQWAFLECAVLFISSCMQFWFANAVPMYLNFGSFSIYQLSSCCLLSSG